jgi:hypothetical protein
MAGIVQLPPLEGQKRIEGRATLHFIPITARAEARCGPEWARRAGDETFGQGHADEISNHREVAGVRHKSLADLDHVSGREACRAANLTD